MTVYSLADMTTVFDAHENTMLRAARKQGRGSAPDTAMRRLARYRSAGIDAVVLHLHRKWAVLRRPSLEQFNRLYDDTNLMAEGATWLKL